LTELRVTETGGIASAESLSWLRSRSMSDERDLSTLVVPRAGAVDAGGDLWEPIRMIDAAGDPVTAVAAFLKDLQASGRSVPTQRSYAMDLLRWFRFIWAIEVPWDEATRIEARDFCRWFACADKTRRTPAVGPSVSNAPNPVTGKPRPGRTYAATTRAHSETVLRVFYDFHREVALGTCGRSYATPCIHEHACVRCPLLRPDLAQRGRLIEVRDNLIARIAEARTQGWLGEADGLQISLAGAREKLNQLDQMTARSTSVHLGMPTFPQVAVRSTTVHTPVR
jgi:hypothetical protein